jgi:hypothetical protein
MAGKKRFKTTDDTDLKLAQSPLARRYPRGFALYFGNPATRFNGWLGSRSTNRIRGIRVIRGSLSFVSVDSGPLVVGRRAGRMRFAN